MNESMEEMRERIAALEAELARLKPSGQVAEDEAMVRTVLGIIVATSAMDKRAASASLSRLAAKAQELEALGCAWGAACGPVWPAWGDRRGYVEAPPGRT